MPVYACYRGDALDIPLEEKGLFALADNQGRNWLCRISTVKDLGRADGLGLIGEFFQMGYRLRELGLPSNDGQMAVVNAANEAELREVLSGK